MKRILLILPLLLLCGCGTTIIDPISPIINGYIIWSDGEATKYYQYDSQVIHRSVKKSLTDMGLKITRDDPPDAAGNYYITAGEKQRFKIKIKQVQSNICKMQVRINFLGDKPYAELLFGKVDTDIGVIHFDDNGNPVGYRHRSVLGRRS